MIVEAMDRLHSGEIGDILAYYATYYTNPVKPMPPAYERPLGMSDVECQIRNWYNFVWLCGDGLVEQAVHSVDKIAWAFRDEPPESCVAVGGRQIPRARWEHLRPFRDQLPIPEWRARLLWGCRQITGCHRENADYILGTKGRLTIGRGLMPRIEGENPWVFRGQQHNMYQEEHDELFRSIRRGEPINDGVRMATSTQLAILGRTAAYTGPKNLHGNRAWSPKSGGSRRTCGGTCHLMCPRLRVRAVNEVRLIVLYLILPWLAVALAVQAADFDGEVRPLIRAKCLSCHQESNKLGD